MKKPLLTLGALAGVLAVLVAGNLIASHMIAKNEEEKASEAESESLADIIHVNTLDDIAKISFNDLDFSYTEENGWSYDEDGDFPIAEDTFESLATELLNLTSSRELKDGDTLENYGLDDPAYTVTLEDSDGNQEVLKIGDAYDSEYYVMVGDDDSVIYTCSFTNVDYFASNILAFAEIDDIITDWAAKETAINITSGSMVIDLKQTEAADEEDADSTDKWEVSLNEDDPYEVTSTDQLDSVKTALQLSYSACIGYNIQEDQLADYGLEDPAYVITIKYLDDDDKEQELVIKIGTYNADADSYSIMSSKSDQVYAVSSDSVEAIATLYGYDFLESSDTETETAE